MRQGQSLYNEATNATRNITFKNIYALNIGVPKYMKQILTNLKRDVHSNKIIVKYFNTHFHQWQTLFSST